jgi:hypothetical protein
MPEKLTSYEQETIINFNEAEDTADIFTYNRAWQRHLEDKLGLKPVMDNGYGGKEYEVSKKRIRPPMAPRKLSAEAKAKAVERLRQHSHFGSQKPIAQAFTDNKTSGKGKILSPTKRVGETR